MHIWLVAGVLLAQTSNLPETALEPIAALTVASVARGAALADELGATCALGAVNGGLIQATSELRAPQAGAFWVACFSTPQSAPRWRRFIVDMDSKAENIEHLIERDISSPTVQLHWKLAGKNITGDPAAETPLVLGPLFTLQLSTQEQSQVRTIKLLVNGIEATVANWSAGLANNIEAVQMEIESEDVLGNVGKTLFGPFKFDAIAPKLAFEVLNLPDTAASAQVGKPPYTLRMTGDDANGAVQLSSGSCKGQSSMQCTITATQTTLAGIDAVGNTATLDIALSVDDQGPSFLVDEAPIAGTRQVKIGDSVELSANDSSGIGKAYARFGRGTRALPMRYRAVQPGRFKIFLVAQDAFGNQSKQVVSIEVRR